MSNSTSHWLKANKQFRGQKPGLALVKWLNEPQTGKEYVEELLHDAQLVFEWITEYPSLRQLNLAKRNKKLPKEFWVTYEKLNESLAKFIYAPQVDLHELPDGERISWTLMADDLPLPMQLLSIQIGWVLQLIDQGAVLKLRRCKECESWFFAQFDHRRFCKTLCQIKHFAGSEKFKKKRRLYMREYNKLQK